MKRRDFWHFSVMGLIGAPLAAHACGAETSSDHRAGKIRLWLDMDIGADIDDAVCLFCAIQHPRIELLGVSTGRGCIGSAQAGAWVAREMLRLAGHGNVPVLAGSLRSVIGDGFGPNHRGTYGTLAPKPDSFPTRPEDDDTRIDAIADAMIKIGAPFQFLTTGCMSNVARITRRRKDATKMWSRVTCMAGLLDGDPECNARLDGKGFHIICRRFAPHLVGMECGLIISRKVAEKTLDANDPASAFLLKCYATYRKMADWDRARPEQRALTTIDAVALISLVRPDLYDYQNIRVQVKDNGFIGRSADGIPVTYALSAQRDKVKREILVLLARKST